MRRKAGKSVKGTEPASVIQLLFFRLFDFLPSPSSQNPSKRKSEQANCELSDGGRRGRQEVCVFKLIERAMYGQGDELPAYIRRNDEEHM